MTPELLGQQQPNIPIFGGGNLAFAVVLVVLAVVSGRLLGIRVSLPRGFAAAFIGSIAGFVFFYEQSIQSSTALDFGTTFGLPALLATMVVLVTFELVGRPGTVPTVPRGLAGLPHPIRALRLRASRGRRYSQVLLIAARNGLNPYLRSRADPEVRSPGQAHRVAISFRLALEQCGGVFVKLGQVLSTRPDLLPAAVIAELAGLQDAVAPVTFAALEPVLVEQFGASSTAVFAEFDEQPLAAASIAQVHLAKLKTGERVVVKVERPRIIPLVERDLDIIERLARTLAARTIWAQRAGAVELAEGFAQAVWEELDFRIEAGNLQAVTRGAATEASVRVPRVFPELSGSRVLVMEWLDGVKLRDGGRLLDELGVDREAVARQLLDCLLRQIMIDGIFHADPHPGNVLIMRDGQPALIDFGSVGRLDAAQQSALRRILIAVDRRDATQMRDALVDIADVSDTRRQDLLERALSQFMARRLGPGLRPGTALFTDLMGLLIDFELRLPPHVAAVFRALVTLEGTLEMLAPGFQIIDESRKVAGSLLEETLTAASIQQALKDEALTQLPILHRLPRRIDQLAATLESGGLKIHVSLLDSGNDRQFVTALAGRAILAFVGAAIGVIAVLLLGTAGGPPLTPSTSVLHALGYIGLVASLILLLRAIVAIARDGAA